MTITRYKRLINRHYPMPENYISLYQFLLTLGMNNSAIPKENIPARTNYARIIVIEFIRYNKELIEFHLL